MQYKFALIALLIIYIFSGYITKDIKNPIENYSKNLQKEIYIDQNDIKVFDENTVDKITVTENKVKAWMIEIKYDENNIDNIKNALLKNGYQFRAIKSKMIFTIGPFAGMSHAREESRKLTKVLGIDNTISSFIF